MTPIWKKLKHGLLITEFGERVQDGRWLCVVEGPAHPPKAVFCLLVGGEWFDDGCGDERQELGELVVTHIDFAPELPAPSRRTR